MAQLVVSCEIIIEEKMPLSHKVVTTKHADDQNVELSTTGFFLEPTLLSRDLHQKRNL